MSQSVDLTPSLTPRYAASLVASVPASPWGRLRPRRPFIPSVDLYNTRYVLGRDNNCDINIEVLANKLSKRHLVISLDETHVPYIEDLSRNGTYLNGRPLKECNNKRTALHDGDIISLLMEHNEVYQFKNESQASVSDEFDSKYVITRLLGQGAFGEVYLAVTKRSYTRYAVKKIKINNKTTHTRTQVSNEVNILSKLNHCCVIHMSDVEYGPGHMYIILEYMEGGELQSRVLQHRSLTESLAKLYMYQMSLAVQYLHANNITHRDLKPENVLLASSADRTILKVTDFGLSKVLGESCVMHTLCGTPLYIAPEIIRMLDNHTPYTAQVDVWSLGCIMFYMLYGRTPFNTDEDSGSGGDGSGSGSGNNTLVPAPNNQLLRQHDDVKLRLFQRIVTGDYTIPRGSQGAAAVSEEAVSLMKQMLVVEPAQRVTVDRLLKHCWLWDEDTRHTYAMLCTNNVHRD